jgi:uncharacterized membrane protein
MTLAATSLTNDPVWPWSLPYLGVPGFLAVAVLLIVLTVATYLVAWRGKRGRLLVILALRLLALLVVYLLLLRPSLAEQDDSVVPTKLIILVDASRSMAVNDELNNQSRWERARSILQSMGVKAALKRLQDKHKVEVVYYQGAENVTRLDLTGKADGKRTDMGAWLHNLLKAHGEDKTLRGLLLFTDGADNGTQYSTLEEAARWRNVPCPIQPFALGSATTAPRQRDIAFQPDKVLVTPSPVHVKNKLTVKGVLNAFGFENAQVTLRLFLDDKEVAHKQDVLLDKTVGNEVVISCDAPDQAGEVKVTLKVDPMPGEVSVLNNEVSTYATVTKDGLSILWVEGKIRAFESVFAIRHVLSRDPRFRVYYTELLRDGREPQGDVDRLHLKQQHYDVIVIGDISAARFSSGKADVFRQIKELIETKQTGLMMLGGYETFANSDWQKITEMNELLPVELTEPGQVDGPVQLRPTAAAFNDYLLGHPGNVEEQQAPWETVLAKLDGMTKLGKVREGSTVYAMSDAKDPVLVGRQAGKGRVLAFAGDTTWKAWRRTPEAIKLYDQFWRQVMLWLAHQEKSGGSVSVEPDSRRLAAGNNNRLGFVVKIRGKTGRDDVKDARFTAKVIGPGKDETEVPVVLERGEYRGSFWKTNTAGDYLIKVTGTGTDPADGKPVEGTAEAKVLGYAEDLESLRPAADHDFLAKVASAGGGKLRPASETELERLLDELNAQPAAQSRPRAELWPDWRRDPASTTAGDQLGALWTSGALVCFLLFGALVCTEWFLRRRWGMV